jgi:(1->4)-alpha-D-glucan 1-alpha-D-glucosylmutase
MSGAATRPRVVPVSTYRLQIYAGFPLGAARDIVPYLARLGVGALYSSPYFAAAPGSTHGYDVSDHNTVNPEFGGREALQAMSAALRAHALSHIVDFVPNHMGIGTGGNARWNDVLENGPSSPASAYFDIEWEPVKEALYAKLLLPILGDQYGRVLERGELRLHFTDGQLVLRYFDTELPINPRQAPRVYRLALDPLTEALGEDDPTLHEFQSIIASLQNLPPYTEQRRNQMLERVREKDVARRRLTRLVAEAPLVAREIEAAVTAFNGEPGRPASFDALHELLEAQPYRLSYWRTASHDINYRRFFDINTLAGIRVENPEVFRDVHRLLRDLIAHGVVDAVRVDHPDGLFDPARYFDMLQELAAEAWQIERQPATTGRPDRPLYVLAEKILSGRERLPTGWAVHGTTGYNYLNELNGLFVNPMHARRMIKAYTKLTGETEPFEDVLYSSKKLIMETGMASELNVLAHALYRIGQRSRRSRDFTLESLRDVMTETVACFPVYRTYVDGHGWSADDRSILERAIARARRRNPAMEKSLFDFLREVVLPRDPAAASPNTADERRDGYPPTSREEIQERLALTMKLQQYTGPVQAKGLEDTSFYRYNLLLSLNDVGGDPERFGRTLQEFHAANAARLRDWPFEMLATSTHDTKVGEDVRARINVLSELPDEWARDVSRWMRSNRRYRAVVEGESVPDRNDEYRFYQALIGIWPPDLGDVATAPREIVERVKQYMIKAVKEAKVHTSWLTPNQDYEDAVLSFVENALVDREFIRDFLPLMAAVARAGAVNSLAQVAIKIGSPGVPDFYQGTELWDLSLVDPDNRRPVDFDLRVRLLDDIDARLAATGAERVAAIAELAAAWPDGRVKLLLTAAGLRLRRAHPELFLAGDYVPLRVETTVPAELVAFARIHEGEAVVVVVPRFVTSLLRENDPMPVGSGKWKTSRVLLPPAMAGRTFVNAVSGTELRPTRTHGEAWLFAGQIFDALPVGLLQTASD